MMSGRFSSAILAVVLAGALLPSGSRAAPAREALVIGNGTYEALPPLPACLLSAHAMAAALRGTGFDVVEHEDVSSGGTDAAIGDFARRVTGAPGAMAFIYVCGYGTAFNSRPFLLPVSARIARPADVLTQGVLAKSLLDVLTRGTVGSSVAALDVVPAPDAPGSLGLDTLAQGSLPDGLGLIVASQAKPPDALTSLAATLASGLKASEVPVASLLSAAQQQVGAAVAAIRPPVTQGYLAGAPPPPPPPPPTPAQAPANPATPTVAIPADDQMTDADRRTVQSALTRLGYYDGKVDSIFGPDTRAAIRRYQHELGAEMDGKLTAAQATKLVNNR